MLGDSFLKFTARHKSQRVLRLFGRYPKLAKMVAAAFLFVVLPLLLAMSLFETYLLGRTAIGGHSLNHAARALAPWERMLAGSLILVTLLMAWAAIRMMVMLWRVLRQNLSPGGRNGNSGGTRIPRPPGGQPPVLVATASFPDTAKK